MTKTMRRLIEATKDLREMKIAREECLRLANYVPNELDESIALCEHHITNVANRDEQLDFDEKLEEYLYSQAHGDN